MKIILYFNRWLSEICRNIDNSCQELKKYTWSLHGLALNLFCSLHQHSFLCEKLKQQKPASISFHRTWRIHRQARFQQQLNLLTYLDYAFDWSDQKIQTDFVDFIWYSWQVWDKTTQNVRPKIVDWSSQRIRWISKFNISIWNYYSAD